MATSKLKTLFNYDPSFNLKEAENRQLIEYLNRNKLQSLSSAVIQLYFSEKPDHKKWVLQNSGVVCFIKDYNKRSYFFYFYNFENSSISFLWEQEVTNYFNYTKLTDVFHYFHSDDQNVAFNFLDSKEADKFYERVTSKLKDKLEKRERKIVTAATAPQVKPREKNNVLVSNNENDNYLTPEISKLKQPNEMKNILKELNIKANRKTIKIVSQYIYDHGGVDKFKQNIQKYKLEPPRIRPPKLPNQLSLPPQKVPELPPKPPALPPNPFARRNKQTVQQNAFDNQGYVEFGSINTEKTLNTVKVPKRMAPPPPVKTQPLPLNTETTIQSRPVEAQAITQSPPPVKQRQKQNLIESEDVKSNVENQAPKPKMFLKDIITFDHRTLKVIKKQQNEETEKQKTFPNDDGFKCGLDFDSFRKAIEDCTEDKKKDDGDDNSSDTESNFSDENW